MKHRFVHEIAGLQRADRRKNGQHRRAQADIADPPLLGLLFFAFPALFVKLFDRLLKVFGLDLDVLAHALFSCTCDRRTPARCRHRSGCLPGLTERL